MIVITICIDHGGYLIIVIKPGVVYFFYESYIIIPKYSVHVFLSTYRDMFLHRFLGRRRSTG